MQITNRLLIMKPLLSLTLLLFLAIAGFPRLCFAQDEDFNMNDFSAADDKKVRSFCTNKIANLSPSRIVGLSYDLVSGFDVQRLDSANDKEGAASHVNLKHGFRIDANVPLVSNRKIIVGATFNYWETRYNFESTSGPYETILDERHLRTAALGVLVFKPLNQKNFIVLQAEAAANGTYNFSDVNPDFGALKYSAALLFGWKFNDNTNFAVGAVRTYRGGRLLHLPAVMWNKTFNDKWGIEALLPSRVVVRRNFSSKSLATTGFEVEGHSYRLQDKNDAPFNIANPTAELRRSEIRLRLGWDKAITDFIWLNMQAGVRYDFRFEADASADSKKAMQVFDIGLPMYFRFGISLVSP